MALIEYDLGNGRKVYRMANERAAPARSHLSCPTLLRPFDEPVQSMADGKWYTSKTALAASHRRAGAIEIGNEEIRNAAPEPDATQRRQDIKRAVHDVLTGNIPPEIQAVE